MELELRGQGACKGHEVGRSIAVSEKVRRLVWLRARGIQSMQSLVDHERTLILILSNGEGLRVEKRWEGMI